MILFEFRLAHVLLVLAFSSVINLGKISGWIEINLGLEEDVKRLYGPSPTECPAPPPDTLNLSLLNLHISRISDFVEDIISLFIAYIYLVSWKNPLLTGFSFVAFLSLTFRFNAEYVGW